MILPKLPYRFRKASQDIIEFRGLNKTENYKDGNLRNSIGLNTAEYPTLTQSKPFVAEGQSGITDMYEHNGKILTVGADGKLVFDGQHLGNIKPGRKQFATVNTRLCIFPDKVYIDLNTLEMHDLADTITAPDVEGAVIVRGNSVTFKGDAAYERGKSESFEDYYGEETSDRYCTYAYGTSKKAVADCWDSVNKVWRNLRPLQTKASLVEWDGMGSVKYLKEGLIIIPDSDGKIVYGDHNSAIFNIDITKYNTSGLYCVITNVVKEVEWEQEDVIYYITNTYTYDVYRASDNVKVFSDMFSEGSVVDVSGSPASLYDGEGITVERLSENGDTLTFASNTFSGAVSYYELTEDIRGDKTIKARYYEEVGDDDEEIKVESIRLAKVTIPDIIKAGKVIYFRDLTNETYMYVWDKQKLKTVAQYEAEVIPSGSADLEMVAFDIGNGISVSKHIPDLDYICESENRLWGVSNRTHTIYASALGLPGEFTEFDVVSTDSYAVAVASENDFTAICAYGGGVCCFKENRLHKILGSFPAEYYMNEYEIAGVQKGSERSLQIIDEVLYYKGKYGVYAYSGGVPRLVSYELGNIESAAKASVADGLNYYISLGDGVYVYDKLHGLWMKQTDLTCNAMVTDGQLIYGLSNGAIFVNSGNVATTKWSAEFTPFDMQGFFKKGFAKLIISAEMGKGALLSVYIREDNQPWRKVYNQAATNNMLLSVPLRVGRCDRFSIKIEGKGIVKLRGISRDVIVGSER